MPTPVPSSPPRRPAPTQGSGHAGGPGAPTRVSRQLRGALLLVSLAWVPVSLVLAIVGTLSWLTVPFAIVLLGAVVYWLKTEAEAERAARRPSARRPSARRAAPRVRLEPASSEQTQEILPEHLEQIRRTPVQPAAASADPSATEGPAAQVGTAASGDEQVDAAELSPAGTAPEAGAGEGTWSPRPVPPPTYTLKAKAPEPRMTAQGVPADVFATPEFADEADELDERAEYARRAANA